MTPNAVAACTFILPDEPGALARFAAQLRAADVALHSITGAAVAHDRARFSCVPENAEQFMNFAQSAGIEVSMTTALEESGADCCGALVSSLEEIAARGENLGSLTALAVDGRYGFIAEVDRATAPGRPPAVIAIGRNYADHAKEMKSDAPERPVVFMKNPASVIETGTPIVLPEICEEGGPQVDYEGELAVILAHDVRDIDLAGAREAIGGYAAANDVSARWWQKSGAGGQFVRGKSFDTFCPIGPHCPASDVGDPQALSIETRLNGELVQQASTAEMIFPVYELVAELSRGTTLLAGTVILTGTPAGVGHAQDPPRYLERGDVVEVTISDVGRVRNDVRQA